MARFAAAISSTLSQQDAFAYMAAFENAAEWDPAVTETRRLTAGEPRLGAQFHLVSRFAGREVALIYEIVRFEPPHAVELEARNPSFRSRDTITVEPATTGSTVRYEALLDFSGVRRVLEPLLQAAFDRVGRAAEAGLQQALNPR
jgi:hypothetical protein